MVFAEVNRELQELIRKEMNEDVNRRLEDMEHIKNWLLKQPHLPDTWDEVRLLSFLRGCSYSLEKCKKKLDMYFTMRTAVPEFFANRDVRRPELEKLLKFSRGPPLPVLTPEGRRIIIWKSVDKKIGAPNVSDVIKMVFMVSDIRLEIEQYGNTGDVYVLDASILSMELFKKISPVFLKKFLVCVQEAYPVKLKGVHIINPNNLVDIVIQLARPFLKEKIQKRIHVHRNIETLYEHIPRECLPEEYGGQAGKLSDLHDLWVQKLKEYTPWFKEQEGVKADESKRPGKPTNYDELFGMDGSFRKLTID